MNLLQTLVLAALVMLNVIAFCVVFSDKRKAIRGKWRTPERVFLLLSLFGGGVGVLAGFFACHHKTKHQRLLAGTLLLTCVGYVVLYQLAQLARIVH